MTTPPTTDDETPDTTLLNAAIQASGLSVRQFAKQSLVRDPRTVWRWLAGDSPLPKSVRDYCEHLIAHPPAHPPKRPAAGRPRTRPKPEPR